MGIYGGSFDPVHHGHLILALDAIEQLALDILHLVPAAANPFKRDAAITAPEHRLAMLHLATEGLPRVVVDDRELRRGGVSFAIETVRELVSGYPGAEIYLLIGEDNAPLLDQWHRFEELRELVRFAAFPRANPSPGSPPVPVASIGRRIDLSSTELRNRVAAGQSIRQLTPAAVAEYIEQTGLYREKPDSSQ